MDPPRPQRLLGREEESHWCRLDLFAMNKESFQTKGSRRHHIIEENELTHHFHEEQVFFHKNQLCVSWAMQILLLVYLAADFEL